MKKDKVKVALGDSKMDGSYMGHHLMNGSFQ